MGLDFIILSLVVQFNMAGGLYYYSIQFKKFGKQRTQLRIWFLLSTSLVLLFFLVYNLIELRFYNKSVIVLSLFVTGASILVMVIRSLFSITLGRNWKR